ncbi:hypothetical protein GIB67_012059 [Kingdonia uniflora]|uniref:Uncharacterized protein n=1 Tax=Kingdonia uniflora TaxID=39325 RepID=A0A7J7M0F2_9MAGN|nr:hypothetical protein GIB67_012059 [Kingdonia uniflora]
MWKYSDVERVGDVYFYVVNKGLAQEHGIVDSLNEGIVVPPIYMDIDVSNDHVDDDLFHNEVDGELFYNKVADYLKLEVLGSSSDDSSGSCSGYATNNGYTTGSSSGNTFGSETEVNGLDLWDSDLDKTELGEGELNEGEVQSLNVQQLGYGEINDGGPFEPPLSLLFKATKRNKKNKTKVSPSEDKFNKKVGNKPRKSKKIEWGDQTGNGLGVEPPTKIPNIRTTGTPKQTENLNPKKKNNDNGEKPSKPKRKRDKPSELPEKDLDELPVIYDSDGDIAIIQTENVT